MPLLSVVQVMDTVRCQHCDKEFKRRGIKNHLKKCQTVAVLPAEDPILRQLLSIDKKISDSTDLLLKKIQELEARLVAKDETIAELRESTGTLLKKVEELSRIVIEREPVVASVSDTAQVVIDVPEPVVAAEEPRTESVAAEETAVPEPVEPPATAPDDLVDRSIRYLERWNDLEPLLERMEAMDDAELQEMMAGGEMDIGDERLLEMIRAHGSVEKFCRFMEEETTRLWDEVGERRRDGTSPRRPAVPSD